MCWKEPSIGDWVTEELHKDDQLSEYDTDSSNDEDNAIHKDEIETVPANSLQGQSTYIQGDPSSYHIMLFYHTKV